MRASVNVQTSYVKTDRKPARSISSGLNSWVQPTVTAQPCPVTNIDDLLSIVSNNQPMTANRTIALPGLDNFLWPTAHTWCASQSQHLVAAHSCVNFRLSRWCRWRQDTQPRGENECDKHQRQKQNRYGNLTTHGSGLTLDSATRG
jgi:hypothetical protein